MTTIVPGQRTALGRHRRELQVILASAPAGAAAVVACTVPAATTGPPRHVPAASDEIFFISSGALLVHADGHVAAIREGGLVRLSCGMPHVRDDTVCSTGGRLQSVTIRCPARHWFIGPSELLTWEDTDRHDPGTARVAARAARDSLRGSHIGGEGGGGFTHRNPRTEPGISRRNAAPAYYRGRPARLWITSCVRAARAPRPITRRKPSPVAGNEPRPGPVPLTGAGVQRTGHRGPTADRQVA